MATLTQGQISFTGGEWSPALAGRSDLAKYQSSCQKLENFVVHPHGGASNRQGLQFTAVAKYISSNPKVRLIPFQFSNVESYILAFGHQYIRFFKSDGAITSAPLNITGITQANPAVVTVTGHGLATGRSVFFAGVGGMTALNGRTLRITSLTADTFSLQYDNGTNFNSTGLPAYTSGGTVAPIYEIASPYTEAHLFELNYDQSYDVLTVVHPSYEPRDITRTGHASWTINIRPVASPIGPPTSITRTVDGGPNQNWYELGLTAVDDNGQESVIAASGIPGDLAGETYTWTNPTGTAYIKMYARDRVANSNVWHYFQSTQSNQTSIQFGADFKVNLDRGKGPPTAQNPFSGTGNYPGVCGYHGQRMWFARTNNKPARFDGSCIASFYNFNRSTPVIDSDACAFTINAKQSHEIRWLASTQSLLIGTSGGEWSASPATNQNQITPTSIKLEQQSTWGSARRPALIVGDQVLFIDGSEKRIRSLGYSLERDGFTGTDLTLLAEHLFEGYTIKDWSYHKYPEPVIWCVRSDGVLLGLTYLQEQEVFAWHKHTTDGEFESVASVQTIGGKTETWFVIKRTVGGVAYRYIEKLTDRFFATPEDEFFVDSGLTYNGSPTSTVSGLYHLEGKEVVILGDGNVHPNKTVTNGQVTLEAPASKIHVGLPYTCDIHTHDFVINLNTGTSQAKKRMQHSAMLKLRRTRYLRIGPNENALVELKFRTTEDYGDPVMPFTGDKRVFLKPDNTGKASLFMRVDKPVSCTVLAALVEVYHGEY